MKSPVEPEFLPLTIIVLFVVGSTNTNQSFVSTNRNVGTLYFPFYLECSGVMPVAISADKWKGFKPTLAKFWEKQEKALKKGGIKGITFCAASAIKGGETHRGKGSHQSLGIIYQPKDLTKQKVVGYLLVAGINPASWRNQWRDMVKKLREMGVEKDYPFLGKNFREPAQKIRAMIETETKRRAEEDRFKYISNASYDMLSPKKKSEVFLLKKAEINRCFRESIEFFFTTEIEKINKTNLLNFREGKRGK